MKPSSSRRLLVVFVVSILLITSVSVFAQSNAPNSVSVRWLTYVDPRFDFSLRYPSDWVLTPRTDQPGSYGERLIISAPFVTSTPVSAPTKIEIGLYLQERPVEKSLKEWSEEYDANNDEFDASRIWVLEAQEVRLAGKPTVYFKKAISPLTEYTYANVSNGRLIWGLWMNSLLAADQLILEQVVASMIFGQRSPKNLRDAYGDLGPFRSSEIPDSRIGLELGIEAAGEASTQLIGYKVPFRLHRYIYCGSLNAPVCQGTHGNNSPAQYAIDVSVNEGTRVYAASYSLFYSSQYNNTGYGNLLKMKDLNSSGYYAFYAHLKSFLADPVNPTQRSALIARSGSSGGAAPHLHFHIATQPSGGNPVALDGMERLRLYPEYPNCSQTTCAGIEALPNEECRCGRVN